MTQTKLASPPAAKPVHRADRAKYPCRAGQWELANFAACGSLANVFRARLAQAAQTNASYALKILRPEHEANPRAVQLMAREAEVGLEIVHPHLVPVFSSSLRRPPYFVAMPWLEGATLERRLAEGQTIELPRTLWIVRQTAEALAALHRAGWMHGDVKPGNLVISPAGHVTLLDLNFARRSNESGAAVDRCILGTFYYIAPELLTSAIRADIRSDIYSLGVVFYEMLAGRRPFRAEDMADLAAEHLRSVPPDLKEFAPHLPGNVIQLVRRMIAKDPSRRPQSPAELIAALMRIEIETFSFG
ncbi:MAG: serine/threonine protein kinase [Pirellulales bacterium]|nr:serine/threonine protein kinase [Pirellulales bacterium]